MFPRQVEWHVVFCCFRLYSLQNILFTVYMADGKSKEGHEVSYLGPIVVLVRWLLGLSRPPMHSLHYLLLVQTIKIRETIFASMAVLYL